MGLLRYQLFLSHLIAFLSLWKILLNNQEKILQTLSPSIPAYLTEFCIRFAPLLLLIGLAIYALSSIGYSMLTFEDCPEAAKEIETQVKEAKIELKKKGVVDF